MHDLEQAIRERAYHLWIESGYEHGNADAHWLAAQREILSASLGGLGRVTAEQQASKPAKTKARRKKKAA